METRLAPLDLNSRMVKEVLIGAQSSYDKQVPINRKLFQAHRDYESNIRKLIMLLKSNPDSWTVQDGYITPYSQQLLDELNSTVEALNTAANQVNTLSQQLFENL